MGLEVEAAMACSVYSSASLKLLTLRDTRRGQFGGRRRRHRGAEAQLGERDNAVEALRYHHRGLGGKVRIFYVCGSP